MARIVLLLGTCLSAYPQTVESADQTASRDTKSQDNVPRVPGVTNLFRGLNAGVSYFGVHSTSIGWYTVATPAVSYTFSRHYSADASTSVYFHRMVQNLDPGAPPDQRLVVDAADSGDTLIGFHAAYSTEFLHDTISASITAPTGNSSEGLGTGRVTFDLADHIEHYHKQFGFLLDLGAGDSSGLSDNLVMKNYNSLGALAHFQMGSVMWLRGNSYVEFLAYEQLPIGSQKIFTTLPPPGSQPAPVVSGTGVSEDNGLTALVGMPLTDHLTLSSYYNRSLRQHLNTVSVGVTYVLRGSQRKKWLSMIDRALREAEKDNR